MISPPSLSLLASHSDKIFISITWANCNLMDTTKQVWNDGRRGYQRGKLNKELSRSWNIFLIGMDSPWKIVNGQHRCSTLVGAYHHDQSSFCSIEQHHHQEMLTNVLVKKPSPYSPADRLMSWQWIWLSSLPLLVVCLLQYSPYWLVLVDICHSCNRKTLIYNPFFLGLWYPLPQHSIQFQDSFGTPLTYWCTRFCIVAI